MSYLHESQRRLCEKYGTGWFASPDGMKVGISRNVLTGLKPLNGLRHPPVGDTTGWYIWAGEEISQDPDFFVPLHVISRSGAPPSRGSSDCRQAGASSRQRTTKTCGRMPRSSMDSAGVPGLRLAAPDGDLAANVSSAERRDPDLEGLGDL
jgi:hypothetical protein